MIYPLLKGAACMLLQETGLLPGAVQYDLEVRLESVSKYASHHLGHSPSYLESSFSLYAKREEDLLRGGTNFS